MSQTQQQELQHEDSIHSQDPNAEENKKKKKDKSRRPPNTAFRQQRLKAWQPILTPKTVLPLFFAVGIIFAPIGGLLLYASAKVQEISIDYSNCVYLAGDTYSNMPNGRMDKSFKSNSNTAAPQWRRETNQSVFYPDSEVTVPDVNKCFIQFEIDDDMAPPVLLYYKLTNFYQNHRRYVKSFDASQLNGNARTVDQIRTSDCDDPLRYNTTLAPEDRKPYYPCGLIGNSIFNDTFTSPRLLGSGSGSNGTEYTMSKTGIAWDSDKALYKPTKYQLGEVTPPPNWQRRWDYTKKFPNLETDEAFQVWMRTAGLPQFSKLAMRNENTAMKKGRYEIEVWDEFNTTLYSGSKSILISTRTVMGGKNPFLGIAYIVVGGLCILLGAVFTATHIVKPRKLGDHTYLSWDKEPSTARTTARAPINGENAS